jgi:Flp pilus assembly pilin Flp
MRKIKNFLRDASGAETVEYAIVVGLVVALTVVAYASDLGTDIQTYLNGIIP